MNNMFSSPEFLHIMAALGNMPLAGQPRGTESAAYAQSQQVGKYAEGRSVQKAQEKMAKEQKKEEKGGLFSSIGAGIGNALLPGVGGFIGGTAGGMLGGQNFGDAAKGNLGGLVSFGAGKLGGFLMDKATNPLIMNHMPASAPATATGGRTMRSSALKSYAPGASQAPMQVDTGLRNVNDPWLFGVGQRLYNWGNTGMGN